MDRSTNIRNMSVIAHGNRISPISDLVIDEFHLQSIMGNQR